VKSGKLHPLPPPNGTVQYVTVEPDTSGIGLASVYCIELVVTGNEL
jgi:hypothetical protein